MLNPRPQDVAFTGAATLAAVTLAASSLGNSSVLVLLATTGLAVSVAWTVLLRRTPRALLAAFSEHPPVEVHGGAGVPPNHGPVPARESVMGSSGGSGGSAGPGSGDQPVPEGTQSTATEPGPVDLPPPPAGAVPANLPPPPGGAVPSGILAPPGFDQARNSVVAGPPPPQPPAPWTPPGQGSTKDGPSTTQNRIVGVLTVAAAALLGFSLFQSYNVVTAAREVRAAEAAAAEQAAAAEVQADLAPEPEAPVQPELFGAIYDADLLVFPEDVPGCPESTSLLAWGELEDGWLLVCGYDPDIPMEAMASLPALSGGSTLTGSEFGDSDVVATNNVTYDPLIDGYRAYLPGGEQLWFSSVNGVMGIAEQTGEVVEQLQLNRYYFVSLTPDKDASREVSYGVEAPEDTADDQVRYLSQLIQSSEEARAALGPAVIRIGECDLSQVDADIRTIEAVRDNREYLISAVAAAPVDQVPGGALLVTQLTAALQASYDADVGYLDWANAVAGRTSCEESSSEVGNANSVLAGDLKRTFSRNWNKNIASAYDVPKVSRDSL